MKKSTAIHVPQVSQRPVPVTTSAATWLPTCCAPRRSDFALSALSRAGAIMSRRPNTSSMVRVPFSNRGVVALQRHAKQEDGRRHDDQRNGNGGDGGINIV